MCADTPRQKPEERLLQKTSWPVNFSTLKSPPLWFANTATTVIFLLALFLLFLAVVAVARLAADLLGSDTQRASEAVKSFLPIAAAVVGLPLIIWRLVILNQQTRISEAKTQIDRETHYTSIFSKSVEQLGQTREVKETRLSEELSGPETIIRTVPNIEVRLGGIHSLARLAEESTRDRDKIDNMLLSYVRENSWIDRHGYTSARQAIGHPSPWDWRYDFSKAAVTDKTILEYEKWTKAVNGIGTKILDWAAKIPETRVDVNEAVDAIPKIPTDHQTANRSRFYECLFVGKKFTGPHLDLSTFERCTFVRCDFSSLGRSTATFMDSQVIGCRFSGPAVSIHFSRSDIVATEGHKLSKSNLIFRACHVQKLSLHEIHDSAIDLSHSDFHNCWLSGELGDLRGEVTIKGTYATLGQCIFWRIKLCSSSDLGKIAFAGCKMQSVDLTDVSGLSEVSISGVEADAGTITPEEFTRPESWPEFDPNFKDDIPF